MKKYSWPPPVLWFLLDLAVRRVSRRLKADATNREFVRMVLKFAVATLGTVSALAAVGVNTASLLASLGIAGLTIGFAAKVGVNEDIGRVRHILLSLVQDEEVWLDSPRPPRALHGPGRGELR